MSILIDRNTKVLVQGITGKIGSFHTNDMINHGTKVVAGVTPGRGGSVHLGVPVFNQLWALDAAANPTGIATSNGMRNFVKQ